MGKLLAQQAGFSFIDLDEYIEKNEQITISRIFEEYGEEKFRNMEKKYLRESFKFKNCVISLGGGTLHNTEIVELIKSNGFLIFINTPLKHIVGRLMDDKKRPLLRDKNGELKKKEQLLQDLERLHTRRLPLYNRAHMTFNPIENAEKNENALKLYKEIQRYG